MSTFEQEVRNATRCFSDAQDWLASEGAVGRVVYADVDLGWHDTGVHPLKGSIALVRIDGPYADLVGDRVRVTTITGEEVLAYVFGATALEHDVSLAMRAWVAIATAAEEQHQVRLEVLS